MLITTTKSGLNIIIRQETPEDYAEIDSLVYRAFATLGQYDILEYLAHVRKKPAFIPELAFVAMLSDGKIVGQVTLYQTDIITDTGCVTQLVLSPISVLPEYFKRGIAREMITHATAKAYDMGYIAVFLQGDPRFYAQFGFEPAYRYGICHETEGNRAEHCMVRLLKPGGLDGITGVTSYL